MEIQESSVNIFYVSRVFALAPYLLKRNAKGVIDNYKLSVSLCMYSITVLTATGKLF